MRAVVQRVNEAAVQVGEETVGRIGAGLLVYVAAAPDDSEQDAVHMADKIAHLRTFKDADGKLNRSVCDVGGAVLVVSAFTVQANTTRGRRPSFDTSASGEVAAPLIERLVDELRGFGLAVATGRFAAHMHVSSVNDGPICLLLESRRVT